MQVHQELDRLPAFRNAVVTIGTFDGVHQGHRKVIEELRREAGRINGETVIITFHPHPRRVVSSAILGVRLLNTLEEKLGLLRQAGVDHVVVVPFTESFANQSAEEYVRDFLVGRFHPHTLIIGYDHRFGRERKGDYQLLEALCGPYGFNLREIPKHLLDDIGISSTRIRQSLLEGDPETAGRLLGYDYFFTGQVVDGDKLGRQLGYPTANLQIADPEKLVPANGIYAVYCTLDQDSAWLRGMMSIGLRPTVQGTDRRIEVNIFDFDAQIYGRELTVQVHRWLREELKFDGLEPLVKQIDQDKRDSLALLAPR